MRCIEVVELMTDYLEGALSPRERDRFEEHIAGCDGCRAYLTQLRVALRVMSGLAAEPVPARIQEELVAAFRNWKSGNV